MKKLILCLMLLVISTASTFSQGYVVGDWFCWDDVEYRATESGDVEMRTCTTCRDENMMIMPPNCGTWIPTDETLADVNKGIAVNVTKFKCQSGVRYCYNDKITWTEKYDDSDDSCDNLYYNNLLAFK